MTPQAPRRGRPSSIDRQAIAEAVLELGTANATMRRVAERLGVSLPGLYHHVKNKDELLRVAAQYALVSNPPPRYDGQHWAHWLRNYAAYIRGALSVEPALLEKFLNGGVKDDGEMEYIGHALEALRAQGLEPDHAMSVWAAVTALAMGTVTETHRERIHAERGHPWLARIFGMTARSAPQDYPTLRAVAASHYDPFGDDSFDERIDMLLNGIAMRYGLPRP
ncbi:TetR family transcriptional regulator [Mycobacterium sp. 1100029.7]|nr:TetR family transcriptional regulator [Mycobacterium sp. 1100029.7]